MPRRFLVTGGAGTIGRALLPRLLAQRDAIAVLLLRARDGQHLQERREELVRTLALDPSQAARLHAVAGNVSAPEFGLSQAIREQLASSISHVIHAAGNVRLNQPIAAARHDCLESARELIRLAETCQRSGRLEKVEYLSTIGVAGCMRGVVPEQRELHPPSYHNTYEQAKAEAEQLIWQAHAAGLPVTVHRPSMVVGDSQSGHISQFQVFYHLLGYLSGQRSWGIVPEGGGCSLDIVPADFVVQALLASSARPDAIGRVFHLCGGPADAMPIDTLVPWLRQILSSRGDSLPSLRRAPPRAIRAVLERSQSRLDPQLRRRLGGLPYLLDYFDTPQQFANRDTIAFFRSCGLELPAPGSYLERVIDYFRSQQAQTPQQGTQSRSAAQAAIAASPQPS